MDKGRKMKKKFISHPQLVMFCCTVPTVMILLELIIVLTVQQNDMFIFLLMIWQFVCLWVIISVIYSYAYKIVEFSNEGMESRKILILWEDIQSVSLKEIKLFKYNLIPTVYLSSLAIFTSKDGREISFAITKKHVEWLKYFSNQKSNVINEFLNNISV